MSDQKPQLAVSAAIVRNGKILLVRRARPPANHYYTFPGGRVEYGETLAEAAAREVAEETGLTVEIRDMLGWREYLPSKHGGIGHFIILPFAARWVSGEVSLNDELDDAKWLAPGDLGGLRLTERLEELAAAAVRLIRD
ncbi:MAG: NUDIX domain-containing protein [Bradyrhizobiaceae bacterium]|nr:MAG: NUDIX domain-containing protein [Bradyrhizobiaceae bacterium]